MVNKKKAITVLILSMIILPLTLSFVSSSFSDFIKTITGEATKSITINVSVSNTAPTIPQVINFTGATTPTEDSTVRIYVNFTASDSDGFGNLNDSSASINLTKSGEALRQNTSCTRTAQFGTNFANYSCGVDLWYYDAAGTYTITTYIKDINQAFAQNTTTTLTYNSFTGLAIGPSALTWASFSPGATNQTSNNDPMLINNTGNTDIQNGNVSINATDLVGELTSTQAIYAANFTVATATDGSVLECNYITANSTPLFKGVFTNISNSTLPHGNHSINNNQTGQENLFYCIRFVGLELSSQPYSTLSQGSWTIKVV